MELPEFFLSRAQEKELQVYYNHWAPNQVIHAEPYHPLHNLRKRRVPEVFVSYVDNILTGCWTQLKFDDYTLNWFELDNSIGQGNPLSMLLYLYYNSDILEVPKGHNKVGLGYVDDMALVAVASDFRSVHWKLKQMMTQPTGAVEWLGVYNSHFEATKSTLLDFM